MVGGFASVVLVHVAKGTASGAAVVAVVAVADALLSAYRSRK
jgi:H+/gluconate symporter-like permease